MLGNTGYDSENIYRLLRKKWVKPTIHPLNYLVVKKVKTERQQNSAYQQTKEYHAWRVKNNYGRREPVENTFFRFKNSFGSKEALSPCVYLKKLINALAFLQKINYY